MADFESLIDMSLKVKTEEETFEIKREVEDFSEDFVDEQTQHDLALLEETPDLVDNEEDGDESYEPEINDNKKKKNKEKKLKKNYQCETCQEKFSGSKALRSHMKIIHKEMLPEKKDKVKKVAEKIIECPTCKKIFTNKQNMLNHIRTIHEGKRDFKCEQCGQEFTENKGLKGHIKRVHDNIRDEQCPHCGKLFFSKDYLRRHIKKVHELKDIPPKERKFQCDMCPKSYNENYYLQNHIDRVHKKLKPFVCDLCGMSFTMKGSMKNHVTTVHKGIREHVCHECGKAYGKKTDLNSHVLRFHEKEKNEKYTRFQCTICEYVAEGDYTLKRHIKNVHQKIREHCCDNCGKRFGSQQALKKHITKFHGAVDGGRIWYTCQYCIGGKALKGPGVYERHLRLVHKIEAPANIKKPDCKSCGIIGFSSKQAFQKHINKFHGGVDESRFYEKMEEEKLLLLQQKRESMLPSPGDRNEISDNDKSNEKSDKNKNNSSNGLLDLSSSSSKDQKMDTKLPLPLSLDTKLPLPLSFGSYETSINSTDPNGKPILGELNFIPMRNSETDEKNATSDQIEENYIGTTTSDYAIDVSNMNTITNTNDEQNAEDYYDYNDDGYMESEDLENSNANYNNMETDMISASKIKHEEVDMDYDNYYDQEAYSSDINDERDEDYKPDVVKDEKCFDKNNIGFAAALQKVKVELEEPEYEEEDDGEESNISNDTYMDKNGRRMPKKPADYGYWKSKAIEIKIDKNEVVKDRFGQVVEKMVKCDACDNVYTGKTAVKTLARHYRAVHQEPKKKDEQEDDIIEKCKLCDKIYRGSFAKTAIKMHMTRHEGEQRICYLCGKDFKNNLGFLVRHLTLKHRCENVCTECGKAFTTKEYLKDHFDRKHADQRIKSREDGIFECVICQRELKKYENAKKHMELFHPPEEENDDDCDDPLKFEDSKVKEEDNNSNAKTGENVEEDFFENGMMTMDTRIFKCQYCGKDYGQGTYAQQGLRRHKYNCPLNPNPRRSPPETCDRCGKVFSASRDNKRNLKRHQEMTHEGKRDYQCDQCGKEFAYKQQYQNHILSVHEGVKLEPKIKDKICPHCPKLFSSNYSMTLHIERVHEGKEPTKGFCDICSKTVSSVKLHKQRVHEGRKDWRCDRCDKCFGEKGTLTKHIKHVHEGIRDKICPQCGKGFACSKGLNRHLEQVHQKIRANRCEFCNKSYSRAEYLKIHQHTIHGKEQDPKLAHKRMNQYV